MPRSISTIIRIARNSGHAMILFLLLSVSAYAQEHVVLTGMVRDSAGRPIPQATVQELNGMGSAVCNASGAFNLEVLAGHAHRLSVTATGYAARLVTVGGEDNAVDIMLYELYHRLDEVWVSAEKRDAAAQREPLSITVIGSRQVREFRIWDLASLSGLSPNLYTANPGDDRNVTSIRGITTTSYDPAVATYIDGVNQFTLDTYISPLLDVERIEILRGPQGTLYGRNAMGGVINVITRKPSNQTRAFAEVSFGNFNTLRVNGGFTTALIKDRLFAGVALQYDGRHGYYTNIHTGSDFDRRKTITGNYYLKYLAGQDWSVQLNIHHNNNRNEGAFPLSVDRSTLYSDPYKVDQNSIATMKDDGANVSLTVRHAGKRVGFLSQTAYQTNYRIYDNPLDADFTSLDAIRIFNNYGLAYNRVRAWTQEFRFSSVDRDRKLTWDAGAYLFSQTNPTKQGTQFGPDAPLLGIPDTGFAVITTNRSAGKGIAAYGQATYKLAKKLQLIAGIRWDAEKRENAIVGEYQVFPGPPLIVRPDTSASASYHAFSPKLALSWQLSDRNLLYVSFSRGFRTGGISPLSSDPSQPPLQAYAPEFSNSFEWGSKNEFLDGRMRLNATLFYTAVRDVQVPTLILPDAVTIIRNAGVLNSKGFEVELSAIPLKGLEVQANLGHTDARYTTLRLAENYDGNRQVFTPAWNGMLAAQYAIALGTGKKTRLLLRGEAFYTGDQYFDLANKISQASYLLVNARAALQFKRNEIALWGRNLGSVKYIAYAYDFGGMHLGAPLTWGITLRHVFGSGN
jgi:iron complex outermembrane receptor protein